MTTAAIYCRISSDPTHEGLGVARQERDCRALADTRGWDVAAVHIDNDRSAYTGKPRPAYQALLTSLKDGEVDAVIAWHPDRLHRSPRELESFIDAIEAAGATVHTVTAGNIDLSTPAGRMTARVVGAVARHESEHRSTRLRRKMLELAEAGKLSGGGTRPYGYEDDRLTIRHTEAIEIRTMCAAIDAGSTVRALIADLHRRNVPTSTGSQWTHAVIRRMLTSPRIAGLRSHRGVTVGPAVWPAIIDEATHHRMRAILLDPARSGQRPNRRYLLTSGISSCALCGNQLFARPRSDGARCYVCPSGPPFGGCGKIKALAEPLEAYVVDVVLDACADGRFDPPGQDPADLDALMGQLVDLEARKAQLAADFYTTGDLTDAGQFRAASAALEARVGELRTSVAERSSAAAGGRLAGDPATLGDRWGLMDLEQQRTVLHALDVGVVLGPARRGFNRFDPGRVTVVWPT